MKKSIVCLVLLSGCSLPLVTAISNAAVTLAEAVAPKNQTVQAVLSKGALVCGKVSSTQGQLIQNTAFAVLNSAGVPVAVTNQTAIAVSGVCAAFNAVPGPAPAGTTNLPTQTTTSTALPPVS